MKKILVALSIVMLGQSLVSAQAATHKKHKKEKKHHHKLEIKKESPPAPAAKEAKTFFSNLSGSVDLASNYVFRGISQTNNNPAIQGSLTYTFPVGIYVNVWSSNVDFLASDGSIATIEIDTIAGFHKGIGDNFTYDISFAQYNYPRARYANYNEVIGVFKYYIFQLTAAYSGNINNAHTSGTYINGAIIYDIPCRYAFSIKDLNFQAAMGHDRLGRAAGNSYNDYSVALTKKFTDTYSVMLQWTGTNGRAHLPPLDDNQIIGTVTASF